jgi:RNA polymerase sigma-70 factor (ECF subfamily)
MTTALSADAVDRLLAARAEFAAFVEARVPSRALAQEILQSAYVRAFERGGALRDEASAVAWFYRVLRNALTDYYRSRASERRALDAVEREPRAAPEPPATICGCMHGVLPALKPEYTEILRRVELEQQPLTAAAEALAITPGNAAVRLHRARQALKRGLEQRCGSCAGAGCLDCQCAAAHGG